MNFNAGTETVYWDVVAAGNLVDGARGLAHNDGNTLVVTNAPATCGDYYSTQTYTSSAPIGTLRFKASSVSDQLEFSKNIAVSVGDNACQQVTIGDSPGHYQVYDCQGASGDIVISSGAQ